MADICVLGRLAAHVSSAVGTLRAEHGCVWVDLPASENALTVRYAIGA